MKQTDVKVLRRELEEYRRLAELMPKGGGWRTAALTEKLHRQAEQLAEYLWEITKMIAKIEDPEIRLIFELRYFRGYTWSEVAEALPVRLTSSAVRMRHDRYIKKNTQKDQNGAA